MNSLQPPMKRPIQSDIDDEWPTLGHGHTRHTRHTPVSIPPVILRLTDGKANFRQMDIAALKAIVNEIASQVGNPKHSESQRGGDLFVYPVDAAQQKALLQLNQASGRPISPALPKSANKAKGIIYRVPRSETNEDLLDALSTHGVINVERFTRTIDDRAELSETVLLTFRYRIPPRVTVVTLSFQVHKYYPSPYKCTKCWHLGHTKNHCSSATTTCRNCGDNHNDILTNACKNALTARALLTLHNPKNVQHT
ncbi:hypothetical protein GHT06_013491 [Daphnia sinensis]|uniref:Uncharacterized protein n=1 Tax=Daphnia sinensis TaxID=1820382 RepID=A0AAD5KSB3_9CRUS|nr:hypothetical protein GHT06_013491 [Daphnia sinensis]